MMVDNRVMRLIASRVGGALLILLLVSLMVFAFSRLVKDDAIQRTLGRGTTPHRQGAMPWPA